MQADIILEATGWVAFGLNVWGNLALTGYSRSGWMLRLACNAFFIPYAVHTGAWALLANHVVFAAINVHGWRRWSRREHELDVEFDHRLAAARELTEESQRLRLDY